MSVNVDSSNWRLATAGGIKYKLLSLNGSFEQENAKVTGEFCIVATDLGAFVAEGLPPAYTAKPHLPNFPALSVKSISFDAFTGGRPVDPFGADSTAPEGTYDPYLKVRVEYGTAPENEGNQDSSDPTTFVEISAAGAGEFLNLSTQGDAVWEGGAGLAEEEQKELNLPSTVIQPEVEWNVKWKQIPYTFFANTLLTRLRNSVGTVNNGSVSLLFNAPAETVLFVGWSMSMQFTWRSGYVGTPPISLEMKFLEKNIQWENKAGGTVQVTHNHFWRPGDGWRRLLIGKTAKKPVYKSSNFDAIFVV